MRELDAPVDLQLERSDALTRSDTWRAIVARASAIHERVAQGLLPVPAPARDRTGAQLDRWRDTLVNGDRAIFARRLAWDDLDEERVRPFLGDVALPEGAELPSWASFLADAMVAVVGTERSGAAPAHGAPLPFDEIFAPFVAFASSRLGEARVVLAEPARWALERQLLRALTHQAARALFLELSIVRAASPFARIIAEASEAPARDIYERFVGEMLDGGLYAFFEEYAVLARKIGVIMESWVDASAELLTRLARDRAALAEAFGVPVGDEVTSLEVGLSDPHAGRRTVAVVGFASGAKVVYKPKNVGAERAFYDVVAFVSARAGVPPLRTLRVVERDGYGWCELVQHAPCADAAGAERYFERAGALLAIVYVLEGVDCHRGNVIASGEDPILIDCEGLMQPRQRVDDMADEVLARYIAQKQLSHSVLRSGMLPTFQLRGEKSRRKVYDISALGGFHDDDEEVTRLEWSHPNTDAMDLGVRTVRIPVDGNGPTLDGRALGLREYLAPVTRGFRAAYAALAEARETLVAEGGLIDRLAREPMRFIFRDTQIYAQMADRLLEPEFLRDGVDRAIELDLLSRPHLPPASMLEQQIEAPAWWAVFGAELRSMQDEDVPYFGALPTEDALFAPGAHRVPGLFEAPSVSHVVERLRALSPEDEERQVAYISASMYGRSGGVQGKRAAPPPPPEVEATPRADELLDEALRIADRIAKGAVRAGEHATWIAPQVVFQTDNYLLYSLQGDLYTGASGVAIFLAAAAKVGGSPELERLARDALRALRAELASRGDAIATTMGIGGASGVGSIVYALTHVGRTLGDPSFFADAQRAAALLTDERIAADATYDVCDGAAGALLGLVTLAEATGDAGAVERAQACARHLVRAAVRVDEGKVGWVTILDRVMSGFSHGAAGIAYALLRLSALDGDTSLRELAREAIAYEDGLFDEEHGNWPDMRQVGEFWNASWCHGAPGIALGRLGGLASLDDAEVRRDIDRGVALTLARAPYDVDYACCGNAGLYDFLISAGRRLGRVDLHDAAMRAAKRIVLRARAEDSYALDPLLPRQIPNPTFFQGMSGIGYTLLRCARPELASVLSWE